MRGSVLDHTRNVQGYYAVLADKTGRSRDALEQRIDVRSGNIALLHCGRRKSDQSCISRRQIEVYELIAVQQDILNVDDIAGGVGIVWKRPVAIGKRIDMVSLVHCISSRRKRLEKTMHS